MLRKCFRAVRHTTRPPLQTEGPRDLGRSAASMRSKLLACNKVKSHRLLRFSFCLCKTGFDLRRHLVRFCDLFRRISLALCDHPGCVRRGSFAALDCSGLFSRSLTCITIFPFRGKGAADDIIHNAKLLVSSAASSIRRLRSTRLLVPQCGGGPDM